MAIWLGLPSRSTSVPPRVAISSLFTLELAATNEDVDAQGKPAQGVFDIMGGQSFILSRVVLGIPQPTNEHDREQ